jgi:hypothetical protein
MPLTDPFPPGIHFRYRTGKLFKSNTPVLLCYSPERVLGKELIRTENKQKRNLFACCGTAGNGDFTIIRFVINHNYNSRINETK